MQAHCKTKITTSTMLTRPPMRRRHRCAHPHLLTSKNQPCTRLASARGSNKPMTTAPTSQHRTIGKKVSPWSPKSRMWKMLPPCHLLPRTNQTTPRSRTTRRRSIPSRKSARKTARCSHRYIQMDSKHSSNSLHLHSRALRPVEPCSLRSANRAAQRNPKQRLHRHPSGRHRQLRNRHLVPPTHQSRLCVSAW